MLTTELKGAALLRGADRVELIVADSSLARALFDGIPAARLLARTRIASDERDVAPPPVDSDIARAAAAFSAAGLSTFETLLRRLLEASPATLERVKRAIGRHARVAVDEGPLAASFASIATLVLAVARAAEPDASLAEIAHAAAAGPAPHVVEPAIVAACAVFDKRLSDPGALRTTCFEACVRLAARASMGPLSWGRLDEAARALSGPELSLTLLRPSRGSLVPEGVTPESATPARSQMMQLERAELDALVARDPRVLAAAVARAGRSGRPPLASPADPALRIEPGVPLDTLIANLARLLSSAGTLVIAVPPAEPPVEPHPTLGPRPSWVPLDWTEPEAAAALADAVERGAMTVPRLRAVVAGGGDPALDAVGAEMLHVGTHPFASATFAEVLARSGRPRDVMRLVTYFAIAPDPAYAARALAACTAPELPRVLSAWLEAMLPANGELAPLGDDPETSSAARLTACVASLAPYPHLYRAVRPLLSRVSEAPPQSA